MDLGTVLCDDIMAKTGLFGLCWVEVNEMALPACKSQRVCDFIDPIFDEFWGTRSVFSMAKPNAIAIACADRLSFM
jgi:hypothetical protein